MNANKSAIYILLSILMAAPAAQAKESERYLTLADGSKLLRTRGAGTSFNSQTCRAFSELVAESNKPDAKIQWSLQNLDTGAVVAGNDSSRRFFGASTTKMFVAAALLDVMKGKLNDHQMKHVKAMITVSSNHSWKEMQREIGRQLRKKGLCSKVETNWTCGKQGIAQFTKLRGYNNTRAFSGMLRGVHGNELNARDTTQFLADTYNKKYPGAEVLWDLMQGYRTGSRKGNKYIPATVYVGGKTGTYSGPTEVNGVKLSVQARNTALFFKGADGKQYGLTVFSNDGRDESVALLAGGLVRDYAGHAQPCSLPKAKDPVTIMAKFTPSVSR